MSYSVRATQRVDYSAQASRQYYAPPQATRSTPQPRGSGSRNQYSPAPAGPQGYAAHQSAPTHPPGPLSFFVAPPGQPSSEPRTQAVYTTYPSRLRTGVTGLMQPENITGGPKEREHFLAELDKELFATHSPSAASTPRDSPAPYNPYGATRRNVTTTSGRRSKMVSYAEHGSDEDEEDEEEEEDSDPEDPASDPEDTSYGERYKRKRERSNALPGYDSQVAAKQGKLKRKKDEMDRGWTWLGDRCPGERVRSQRTQMTKHHYLSTDVLEAEAQKREVLVPITIDFDVASPDPDRAGIKIKDRFLWNLNEIHISPYQFSCIFCEDTGIPVNPYARTVSDLIESQIEESQNASEINVVDRDVTDADVAWTQDDTIDDIRDAGHEDLRHYGDWTEADCRIILNLDVQIYTHILRDRIEWDLSSPLPPTTFARHYCTELGLTGEAIPLIAHAICEEILRHKRDCLELELFAKTHPDEQAKWEKLHGGVPRTTNRAGARGLKGIWRDWWEREEFGPMLVELSMDEMEKREMERTREARRLMRGIQGKRRR